MDRPHPKEPARPDPVAVVPIGGDFAVRLFRKALDLVMKLLVPLVVVALMMGVAKLFLGMWAVWKSPTIAAGFDVMVTDVLSMFVVIELLRSILEYADSHRIRITFVIDAALVFLVREVMIGLYKHALAATEVAALAMLLLVLGAVRLSAVRFSPDVTHAAPR
ncbi:MAG TPA: phosphate-starvation-inducible PsiE family protein [Anaeromyxobacteraceae bacterium]|nr:phosphate-starvation-inducible PsiE family protein [Anaeromyxobacteraceae bacterium]